MPLLHYVHKKPSWPPILVWFPFMLTYCDATTPFSLDVVVNVPVIITSASEKDRLMRECISCLHSKKVKNSIHFIREM